MTGNARVVSESHELLKGSVHEEEVPLFATMRELHLLLFKPVKGLHREARGSWELGVAVG